MGIYITAAGVFSQLNLSTGVLVPAAILLLAMVSSASILVATQYRQARFDRLLGREENQLDKDRETLDRIFWKLDEGFTPETIEDVFKTIHHYAWTMTHPEHIGFCVKIRDYDPERLKNFDQAAEFLTGLRLEAKQLLGH